MLPPPPTPTLFPYTTLFRSSLDGPREVHDLIRNVPRAYDRLAEGVAAVRAAGPGIAVSGRCTVQRANFHVLRATVADRKSTRLNSSHRCISYAVFCLKKKKV